MLQRCLTALRAASLALAAFAAATAFDVDLGGFKEAEECFLEAIPREQLRDSNAVIKRAPIFEENVVTLSPESDSFLVTTSDTANNVEVSSDQEDYLGFNMSKKSYNAAISMIAGSLVGNDTDAHGDSMNQAESTVHQNELPTLSDAASSQGVRLDEK